MYRKFITLLACLSLLLASWPAVAQVRIKDIADLEGVRDNQLVGYGLVVGLNGTGDKLDNAVFTRESLVGMLERLGVNTRDQIAKLETKNIAAVMVTANALKKPPVTPLRKARGANTTTVLRLEPIRGRAISPAACSMPARAVSPA